MGEIVEINYALDDFVKAYQDKIYFLVPFVKNL